jgi:hypothetical protein
MEHLSLIHEFVVGIIDHSIDPYLSLLYHVYILYFLCILFFANISIQNVYFLSEKVI